MDFFKNNILTIITILAAIYALYQTHIQIRISNKQFLFEKRLEKYVFINSLIKLYEQNKKNLAYKEKSENEPIIVDIQFYGLTNHSYFLDIRDIINDVEKYDLKVKFLMKLEELKKISNETNFLFSRKEGKILQDFIYRYQDVLMELYKYEVFLHCLKNDKKVSFQEKSYNELQEEYGEMNHRKRLCETIDKLDMAYKELLDKKIVKKIEKVIHL